MTFYLSVWPPFKQLHKLRSLIILYISLLHVADLDAAFVYIITARQHSLLCRVEVCGNGFYYSQSLPFPRGHSHSHSREITNRNISRENVRNVFRVHRLRVRETRRTEYKYTDISDYSKHKALSTLATIVAEFGNGDEFGDSRGQCLTE